MTSEGYSKVKIGKVGDDDNQKDYYDRATHYDIIFRSDNIRLGYFPHLAFSGTSIIELDICQAGYALTQYMVQLMKLRYDSKVLDLGCGKGRACFDTARATGASVTGVDLSTTNVNYANKIKDQYPDLKCDFMEADITSLPKAIKDRKFTHIMSVQTWVHVHSELDAVLKEAASVLEPGGIVVCEDFCSNNTGIKTEKAASNFYKRLHFDSVIGPNEWMKKATDAGFTVVYFENLRDHMKESYRCMRNAAKDHGLQSADGGELASYYQGTMDVIESGEICMIMAVLKLRGDAASDATEKKVAAAQGARDEKGYYDTTGHYDTILGKDNIRLGFFPHLEDPLEPVIDIRQAGDGFTNLAITWGQMNASSTILDMGCGSGLCCVDLARTTGAHCTGFDLSSTNINRAHELKAENPQLSSKLEFCEGSFTDLPACLNGKKYSHVISMQSFIHCHEMLPQIFQEAKKSVAPGGVFVVADLCSNDRGILTAKATKHFYERLHIHEPKPSLVGPRKWVELAEEAGFQLIQFKDCGQHMEQSYIEMEKRARAAKFPSQVGDWPLADDYKATHECIHNGEMTIIMTAFKLKA